MSTNGDFDWSIKNGSVILGEQRATAVFIDPHGNVHIRQQRSEVEQFDDDVMVHPEYLPDLITALIELCVCPRFILGKVQ